MARKRREAAAFAEVPAHAHVDLPTRYACSAPEFAQCSPSGRKEARSLWWCTRSHRARCRQAEAGGRERASDDLQAGPRVENVIRCCPPQFDHFSGQYLVQLDQDQQLPFCCRHLMAAGLR